MAAIHRESPPCKRSHRKPLLLGIFFFLLGWILVGRLSNRADQRVHRMTLSVDERHQLDTAQQNDLGPPSGVHLGKKSKRFYQNLALGTSEENDQHGSMHDGDFQKLGNGTYIYSAYYDRRDYKRPVVKVIAIASQRDMQTPFFCHLHYGNILKPVVTSSSFVNLDFDTNTEGSYQYNSSMIICNVTFPTKAPRYVSLTRGRYEPPTCSLPVQSLSRRMMERNFTVCFHQALKYNYRNFHQFVEAIEVNKIFGADHFVLYNHSGNSVIRPYALYYMQKGYFDFYNWPMRDDINNHTFNYGQSAIINDCLYRYMYNTKYLVFVDFDELFVPRKHRTWQEMIAESSCDENFAFVYAQNSFFRLDYTKDNKYMHNSTLSKIRVNSLSRTLRDNYTWPCTKRSKFITRPENVLIAGVHTGKKETGSSCCLPEELSLLHHYRFWNKRYPSYNAWRKKLEDQGQKRLASVNVRDRNLYRFADEIYKQVHDVRTLVNQSDQLAVNAELLVPWWK